MMESPLSRSFLFAQFFLYMFMHSVFYISSIQTEIQHATLVEGQWFWCSCWGFFRSLCWIRWRKRQALFIFTSKHYGTWVGRKEKFLSSRMSRGRHVRVLLWNLCCEYTNRYGRSGLYRCEAYVSAKFREDLWQTKGSGEHLVNTLGCSFYQVVTTVTKKDLRLRYERSARPVRTDWNDFVENLRFGTVRSRPGSKILLGLDSGYWKIL